MMFLIFLGLVVVSIAFFHYTQGFFSAAISAILCIFSAVLAVSYHEIIVEKYLAGAMTSMAHGATVMVLFAAIYLICRTVFDKFIPDNVSLPAAADKAGAAVMGLVAGFVAAGLCAFAAQSMSFRPALMGYSRLAFESDRDAAIPQSGGTRTAQLNMHDSMNSNEPLHIAQQADQQKLMLPADDFLIDMIMNLSDSGALASRPLASVHPNWLNELYGQRLGIQSAANRIAMNKADGTRTDLHAMPSGEQYKDAGVYWLDRQLPAKVHEFDTIARMQPGKLFPKVNPKSDPSKITVVFRVYFGDKVRENKDNIIRFSPGSVRLVTQKKVIGGEGYEWTNYYPLGTLEEGAEFWYNRADDFMFIDDRQQSEGVQNKGVDLVFQVEKDGFLKNSRAPDPTQSPINDGTFIEVKRMARVDLSNQPIQPMSKLRPSKSIQVMRKVLVKKPAPKSVSPDAAPTSGEEMQEKLVGQWQVEGAEPPVVLEFGTGGKLKEYGGKQDDSGNLVLSDSGSGTYQVVSSEEGKMVIQLAGSSRATKSPVPLNDRVQVTFSTSNQITITDKGGLGKETTLIRRENSNPAPSSENPSPQPAPSEPSSETPKPAAPKPAAPQPAAMKADTSLVVVEVIENRKFYAPIRIPDGSSGEVAVAGGTVTLEEGKLRAIKVGPITPEKLNAGTGEPINQLVAATGSRMVQMECTPGPDGGGWAWKEKLGEISLVDGGGNKYRPVGAWATVNGGAEIVADYNADGVATLGDVASSGPPTKIYLAFVIPEDQQITKAQVGEAPLKAFNPPVP